jgi:putative aldouronate transport system substrate-binding protein
MVTYKRGMLTASCSMVLAGILVAGCSGGAGNAVKPFEAAKSASEPAKLMTLSWMRYEHPSQALDTNSVAVQEILKRKNVKLELQSVPQSNYEDKKKTLIATNSIPDVLLVNQSDLSSFADSGIFLDLTPYLDALADLCYLISLVLHGDYFN